MRAVFQAVSSPDTFRRRATYCNWLSLRCGLSPCYAIQEEQVDPSNHCPVDRMRWLVTCDFSADGYRLPTEAEWEFAARGGTGSHGYRYAGSDDPRDVGWFLESAEVVASRMLRGKVVRASHFHDLVKQLNNGQPQPVGRKQSNELGLYDMSGNVREWCWDWYDPGYYSRSPKEPRGPSSGSVRVNRGGAWRSNVLADLEVAHRNYGAPGLAFTHFGFRMCSGLRSASRAAERDSPAAGASRRGCPPALDVE
jgi:formylglycine-generating enzyme